MALEIRQLAEEERETGRSVPFVEGPLQKAKRNSKIQMIMDQNPMLALAKNTSTDSISSPVYSASIYPGNMTNAEATVPAKISEDKKLESIRAAEAIFVHAYIFKCLPGRGGDMIICLLSVLQLVSFPAAIVISGCKFKLHSPLSWNAKKNFQSSDATLEPSIGHTRCSMETVQVRARMKLR